MGKRWGLVLAAGKGKRFNSSRPKVLHELCGKAMIEHILDRLEELELERILVVVGHGSERIQEALQGRRVEFLLQQPQLGTGHAVMMASSHLEGIEGSLLVVYGDTPRITTRTLTALLDRQVESQADQVLLTCELQDPTGYGRILRDPQGQILGIVEERDASPAEQAIQEVNPGFYCFRIPALLQGLKELTTGNAQAEYYLTDLVQVFRESGKRIETIRTVTPEETVGINDRVALSQAEAALRREILHHHMTQGVTILKPETVTIDLGVRIGADTTIYPGATLEGATRVGRDCRIGPWTVLRNAVLGDEVNVESSSVISSSTVGDKTTIGPFAHLRKDVVVGSSARIGNFVELKNSRLGNGVKSAHLAYLGDSEIGDLVNIGAGVITCNYDGWKKHRTIVEEGAFVGSDSQLIAPVRVGKGAYIASGSTITDDVPEDSLAIARSRQTVKKDWVRKQREKKG